MGAIPRHHKNSRSCERAQKPSLCGKKMWMKASVRIAFLIGPAIVLSALAVH